VKQTTIKVNISGREYPVNVSPELQAAMQKAGAIVNEELKKYSSSYAITDPRDLLAMCALQLAFQQQEKEITEQQNLAKINSKVDSIEAALKIS
jgi:cell division protein ZapA (FtsZ GTPase activity inhibitor)